MIKSKVLFLGFGLLSAIAMFAFLIGYTHPMSESVIDKRIGVNGDFEQSKNGLPYNWLVYTQKTTGEGDFDISLDTTNFKQGTQSLRFSVRECSAKGGRFSPGISQELSVKTGEEYLVSFWVKNRATKFLVAITGVDAFTKSDGPKLLSSENIDEWREFKYLYKVPEPMSRLRLEVTILKPGTFWIDDVKFDKVNNSK